MFRPVAIAATALLFVVACAGVFPWHQSEPISAWKQRASALRELEFLGSVSYRRITRAELPKIVYRELTATYSPDFVERYRDAYAAMGLLPPDLDLLQTLMDLLSDQLVGLYSPHRRTLYVVRGMATEAGDPSLMIVIHELVHALQHQHFPATVGLLQTLKHHDDVVLAIGSSVEGDASLTMLASDPNAGLGREMEDALLFQQSMLLDLEGPRGVLAQVPRLVRVAQVFPYAYGTLDAALAYGRAGNRGLDAQLRSPPLSTLQVRFPEEDHPVEFVRLPLEALAAQLEPRGCVMGHSNVAGMLTIQVFLQEYDPHGVHEELIRDWAGDRFVHVYCPEGWELAWLTRWTEAAAAAEFARRYRMAADAVAGGTPLSGPPHVIGEGRTTLVVSPGLEDQAELILKNSEVRSYGSFGEWTADDCFPESPCPGTLASADLSPGR